MKSIIRPLIEQSTDAEDCVTVSHKNCTSTSALYKWILWTSLLGCEMGTRVKKHMEKRQKGRCRERREGVRMKTEWSVYPSVYCFSCCQPLSLPPLICCSLFHLVSLTLRPSYIYPPPSPPPVLGCLQWSVFSACGGVVSLRLSAVVLTFFFYFAFYEEIYVLFTCIWRKSEEPVLQQLHKSLVECLLSNLYKTSKYHSNLFS